jgi:hypothetical protein
VQSWTYRTLEIIPRLEIQAKREGQHRLVEPLVQQSLQLDRVELRAAVSMMESRSLIV